MIEPIRLSFEVDCPVDQAFEVWTARIAQWWPKDHTVSAEDDLRVGLEGPQVGVPLVPSPYINAYLYGALYGPIALPCSAPLVVGIFALSIAGSPTPLEASCSSRLRSTTCGGTEPSWSTAGPRSRSKPPHGSDAW